MNRINTIPLEKKNLLAGPAATFASPVDMPRRAGRNAPEKFLLGGYDSCSV